MIEQTTFLIAAAVALLFLAVVRSFAGKRPRQDDKRAAKRRERRLRKRRTIADRRDTIRDAAVRRDNGSGRRTEDQWETRTKF